MEVETSGLVRVRGVFCFIQFDVHTVLLFTLEVARVYGWERRGLGFREPKILPCLIQTALGGFSGILVVVVDVFDCKDGTSNVVTGAYGLHPHGFDSVPADGVHPIDALCNGW